MLQKLPVHALSEPVDLIFQIRSIMLLLSLASLKGALDGRATDITEEMKLAAALALAGLVSDEELNDEHILPEAFDPRAAQVVADAVKSHIR